MRSKLKLLPRYLLNMGLWHGMLIYWQVELLKLKKIQVKGFKLPLHLRPGTTDISVFREVFLFKSYDIVVSNPTVIIDGGANIGLASLFFAQKFSHSKIYSVEPDDSNFEVLCKNTKHLGLIIPIHSALWNKDVFLKINNKQKMEEWAFAVEECEPSDIEAFQGLSLYSLMQKYNINRIDILKLDVEGSEKELFTDNYDYWITRTKYILIELHDWMKIDISKTAFRTLSEYHFTTTIFNGMLLLTNQDID